jgi:hypothetical protein
MARAFLLFDFGSDEDAVQKARHRIEAWKQAFRLGNKVQFKLERKSSDAAANPPASNDREPKGKPGATKRAQKPNQSDAGAAERIRFLVRLDFSAHEKNLFQTWFERIPSEEPFKSAKPETVQHEAANFVQVADLFDSLD